MKQETITLDEFNVTIRELKIKDVRMVIANIKEIFDDDVDVQKFIDEKYDAVIDIAQNFISVSGECSIDDMTFSDIDKITPAFKRVNESFLDKLVTAGIIPPMEKTKKTSKRASTKQSPH